jgi:Phage protein (N4 Gp49/phage Sf6 gene 66) family
MSNQNKVTPEHIAEIIGQSTVDIKSVFGKTTIVSVQLPNGFVIVESSSCVDPVNYNEDLGAEICFQRIENKLWELEGYVLQNALAK